jgi:large subunit ribosomal protein L35
MPKLKTHKSSVKRLRLTSTGKLLRMHGLRGHLRRKRNHRATEKYDKMQAVSHADTKRLKLTLPYGTP